jgi:VIT1/CCC1 family predicted Fe2+/Mn2+ transporter
VTTANDGGSVVDLDDANTVRAGVFGVQDGIVSTFGLVMGVAGAQVSPETVLIAGIAGAFSGAVSMGAGEYVSVRVQHELIAARGGRDGDNVDPLRAAVANAGLFVFGAAFPLTPFLFLVGLPAVVTSSSLSVVALFLTGALLTRLTRRSPWISGLRMLLIGGGAGVLGYAVGSVLGVAVG